MQRILIIGSSGAGKSTLSRQLGNILGLEVIHLDAEYWQPGWVETPKSEWQEIVQQLVQRDRWIMDGNYGGTLEIRLAAADTVIFLDLPRLLCVWRALKRWRHYAGRTRPDVREGCPEKMDWEFLQWIWNYPVCTRPKMLEKMRNLTPQQQVVMLRSPIEVKRFIAEMNQKCNLIHQ